MVVRCRWSSNIERKLEQGLLHVKGMGEREKEVGRGCGRGIEISREVDREIYISGCKL